VTKDSETHVLEGGILGELKAYLAPNEGGGFSSIHQWRLVADPLMCSNLTKCRTEIKARFLKRHNENKDVGLSAYTGMMERLGFEQANCTFSIPGAIPPEQKHVTGWRKKMAEVDGEGDVWRYLQHAMDAPKEERGDAYIY